MPPARGSRGASSSIRRPTPRRSAMSSDGAWRQPASSSSVSHPPSLPPTRSPYPALRTDRRTRRPDRAHRSPTSCRIGGRWPAGCWPGWPRHFLPRWTLVAGRRRRGGRPCRRRADRVAGAERSEWSAHRPRRALAPQPATASGGARSASAWEISGPRTEPLISAHCLRFDPPEPAELPARTARGVVVTLSPERPFEPGIYRGVIQAEGAPNLSITFELTVQSGSSS